MNESSDPRNRRVIGALLVAAPLALVGIADAGAGTLRDQSSSAQTALRCEAPTLGRDTLSVSCALEAGAPRLVHFRIHLTGSHDDTTGSLEVAVSGAPVPCEAGSKTNTEGEDGDVTLECRFIASGRPSVATNVSASARWFHAQFVGFDADVR